MVKSTYKYGGINVFYLLCLGVCFSNGINLFVQSALFMLLNSGMKICGKSEHFPTGSVILWINFNGPFVNLNGLGYINRVLF